MTYNGALRECQYIGLLPAEIESEDQQIAIQNFLRTKIPIGSSSIFEIRTGMRYDPLVSIACTSVFKY